MHLASATTVQLGLFLPLLPPLATSLALPPGLISWPSHAEPSSPSCLLQQWRMKKTVTVLPPALTSRDIPRQVESTSLTFPFSLCGSEVVVVPVIDSPPASDLVAVDPADLPVGTAVVPNGCPPFLCCPRRLLRLPCSSTPPQALPDEFPFFLERPSEDGRPILKCITNHCLFTTCRSPHPLLSARKSRTP